MWGYLFAEIHTVALIDVSDGDMAALQGCLEDLPNLRGIWIFNRGGYVLLTDSGLGHLSELVTLQRLELEIAGPNKITGGGVRRLHKLKELRELYLKNSVVVNADLDALQAFPKLEFLSLSGTNIDDSGLKMLDGRTTLQFLNIENTQVTRDGVAAFRLAHPNCSVAR